MQAKRDYIKELHKKYAFDLDHELLVWEKWIKIRQDETSRLGKIVRRPPVDLTMNLLEGVREDKERKVVLENAQIPKKPSIRGGLWEQPQRLKQHCYCQPVYEFQRTQDELGQPSIMEHIGCPEYVKTKEKGLSGLPERKPCHLLDADYENYRNKREDDLKERIKNIDPFRPKISGLMIKGNRPVTPPKKLPPLPTINIISPAGLREDILWNVYALRINNTVFFKEELGKSYDNLYKMQQESWHEVCTSWTYYFNIPVKKVGRSKLYLENLGTVTLRYCWKKIKRPIPFIPEDIYEQVFFFNKNEDVLFPGQSREIYFTFVTDKAGIHSEFWELNFCNVCFFDTLANKFIINFYADCSDNLINIKKKVEMLKHNIDKTANDNFARNLNNDAVMKASAVTPQNYPYKKMFLEAELFIMKNPVCFYHQTEVLKMKELYKEMEPNAPWDLSISSWRECMLKKEYDDRMKYYELLRKSHSEFLKPWYEGEDLLKEKHRAIKLLLGQFLDKFDIERQKILDICAIAKDIDDTTSTPSPRSQASFELISKDLLLDNTIQNLFYMHIYEHFTMFIELCAGVLSSLDLNRWIQFDFCRI